MPTTRLRPRVVSLRELLPKAQFLRGDIKVSSCSSDWKTCQPGELFVALTTADDDGHDHAAEAIARGAIGVVAERLIVVDAPVVIVPDSRVALGRLSQALAGHPCREMRAIGITGSAGKTVTSMLIASVLEKAGEAVGVMSSIGNSDSLTQIAPERSTPTTGELATWLTRMATAGCQSAVIELSSRALAERRASGMELDIAVLTNLRGGHLSLHNSPKAYVQAKQRLFRLLKAGGLAIVNADDHRCRNLISKLKVPCLTFGLHAEADISATVLERHKSEQTFLITAGEETVAVRTSMIGDHHVSNCLAATAVGLAAGIDLATIARGLEAVDRVPGRLERLECGQEFGVFVDAAQTPDTLALSIKAIRQVTTGRVFVIAGCKGEREKSDRPLVGRVLERGSHVQVLTSDDPRHEVPLAIAHDILDGFERPHRARIIPDRAEAIRWALSQARQGDSVLICGKGDLAGQIIGGRRMAHDDREIACEWLYGRGEQELAQPRLRIFG